MAAGDIDLASLTPSQGFVIKGAAAGDDSGFSVSNAGDVNGDGFDDLIVGAYGVDPEGRPSAGASYVVYGKEGGYDSAIDLAALDSTQGFVIKGAVPGDESGWSVSNAGDVNGDGIDDLIVGARAADPDQRISAGASYVVYGKEGGYDSAIDLAALDSTQGFVIKGAVVLDDSGWSVSAAGDVNGDGIDDLIVGAVDAGSGGRSEAGASYVVYGKAGGYDSAIDLAALTSAQGFVIKGAVAVDNSGWSVSNAGDVNGDGFDDLIVGAIGASPDGRSIAGASYVVYGKEDGYTGGIDLAALTSTQGFVIKGAVANDNSGYSVSAAGDVNGDGIDDLIIGAYAADPEGRTSAGASYIVYGKAGGYDSGIDLAALDSTQGFVIKGAAAFNESGYSVSGAGDVNGDGFDDLIVGAIAADPEGRSNAGASYVVYGKAGGYDSGIDLAALDTTQGFVIKGAAALNESGYSVSGAGDVNGDGFDDLIVGAFLANPEGRSGAGASYVVYGFSTNQPPTVSGPVTLAASNEDAQRLITTAELVANAHDNDGDTLSVVNLTVSAGALVDNADGTWTYTPAANDDTGVTFSYDVSDGQASVSTIAALDLLPVNDAPVFANLGPAPTLLEQATGFLDTDASVSDLELATAFNYRGAVLTLERQGGASADDQFAFDLSGTDYVAAGGVITEVTNGRGDFATYTIAGGVLTVNFLGQDTNVFQPFINAVLQHITYSNASDNPPASVVLEYAFNDGNTGAQGSGGALTGTGLLTVNITPVNDAPSGLDGHVTATEDTLYTFAVSDFGFTDPESNALSSVIIASLPGNGVFTLNGVAVTAAQEISAADIAAGHLTFAAAPNANGDGYASLTFQVRDNGGVANGGVDLDATPNTLTIDVTPVNDGPTVSGPVTLTASNEDAPRLITTAELTATAHDGDGDTLSVINLTVSKGTLVDHHDGTFTYTPAANDDTGVTFSYEVSDGQDSVGVIATLDLLPVNDAPTDIVLSSASVAENALGASIGTLSSIDPDLGDTASYTISGGANRFEIVNGVLKLKDGVALNYESEHSVALTITATDSGGLSLAKAFTIAVTNVNDAPVITSPTHYSVEENETAVGTVTASDEDHDALTFAILGGKDAALFGIDAHTGALSFLAAPDFEAPGSSAGTNSYEVTVAAIDGHTNVSRSISVDVTDADDATSHTGTPNNDTFHANDAVPEDFDGLAGRDTVIFQGNHTDYIIEPQDDGTVKVTHGTVVDTLTSIERLAFGDGTLAFDVNGDAGQIYRLYQAAFDRAPDVQGLGYWIGRLDSGTTSLNAIADSFIHSPEFVHTYGTPDTVSNADYVTLLYEHALGREPDQQGFDYWVDKLDHNQTNRGDLLAFFSESDENVAHTQPATHDGIFFT